MKNEPRVPLDEIARHMGVSRDSVYRAIENRGLPVHKIGRLWKTCPPQPLRGGGFKVSEVDALGASRKRGGR